MFLITCALSCCLLVLVLTCCWFGSQLLLAGSQLLCVLFATDAPHTEPAVPKCYEQTYRRAISVLPKDRKCWRDETRCEIKPVVQCFVCTGPDTLVCSNIHAQIR